MSKIPYPFVLEELEAISPHTKPMFGALGVYLGERIIFILRQKDDDPTRDNGIWIATRHEHHASLQLEFPEMRSLIVFGPGPTEWQNLPGDSVHFEEMALKACELVKRGDPRIGKVPKGKRKLGGKKNAATQRLKKSLPPKSKKTKKASPRKKTAKKR